MKDNSGAAADTFSDKPFCFKGVVAAMAAELSDLDELTKYGFTLSEDESESEG